MKKNLNDFVKGAKDLTDHAKKIGKEAAKTAGAAKDAAQIGVQVASKFLNKQKIAQTLEATSKGLDLASKGMGAASKAVKGASDKIKGK